jgi:pyruvate-formate lyase-activating enzyme
VHLKDMLALRTTPGAGVSIGLTRRCPLHCAHCSTNSTLTSDQAASDLFVRFVDSFTTDCHPQVLALSGGEAFLRPELVARLARRARAVGCYSTALSGMFWARESRIPPAIRRAIAELDHFSVSLDAFHEMEVPRAAVYQVLETLLDDGQDVSIHLVGLDAGDPYLATVTEEVPRRFGGRVPMLVNNVAPNGRALNWLTRPVERAPAVIEADPCTLSVWPVVAFDGTMVGCGNDDVVDGPAPAHLRVGHIATEGWPELYSRFMASHMLRAIRTFGPAYLNDRQGSGAVACTGYCGTCQNLSHDPGLNARVEVLMSRPSTKTVERNVLLAQQEVGPESYIRRYGLAPYAELISLGAPA